MEVGDRLKCNKAYFIAKSTKKMTFAPNNVYLSDLTKKVVENNRLMVIGYSFGDLYLNEILGLGMAAHGADFKVVIIDMFPTYIGTYHTLFQHVAHRCNTQLHRFVSRLSKDRLHIEIGQDVFPLIVEDYNKPVVSRNGKLMMCISGFKDAVMNHKDAIMEFLGV